MSKRHFIQQAAIRFLDLHEPDVDRAIAYAERLWQRLCERGYGAVQNGAPREHLDWYGALSAGQRAAFDRFWSAFDLKRGRNGAAMRWAQINPDAALAEHIIHAAGLEAEARKKLSAGQSPIMAQGWLHARRWEDYPPPAAEAADTARRGEAAERQRLHAEIKHLERLLQFQDNAQLREQRDELAGRLAVLEVEADG